MSGGQALHDASQDASSTRQTDLGSLSAQLFAPRPQVCFNTTTRHYCSAESLVIYSSLPPIIHCHCDAYYKQVVTVTSRAQAGSCCSQLTWLRSMVACGGIWWVFADARRLLQASFQALVPPTKCPALSCPPDIWQLSWACIWKLSCRCCGQ